MTLGPSPLNLLVHLALILWPERTLGDHVTSTDLSPALKHRFAPHLHAMFPQEAAFLPEPEINAALATALDEGGGYCEWWSNLLVASDLKVDFADREPRIGVDQAELWEQLQDHVDPDAVITQALWRARRGRGCDLGQDIGDLTDWDCVVRVGDRDLQVLWRRGLSDLHIHVGGARFGPLIWYDLMDGLSTPDRFPHLVDKAGQSLEPVLACARAAQDRLYAELGLDRPAPLVDGPGRRWRWDIRRIRQERVLLAAVWGHRARPSGDLVRALDRYLLAKSIYTQVSRQPTRTPPGLAHFDGRYFGRLKPRTGLNEAYASSRRLRMQSWGDALYVLLASPDIHRIELRMAPFRDKAVEYPEFARDFDELVRAVLKARRPKRPHADVRFAVHFKRTRKPGDPLGDMLIDIDRESAALRLALSRYADEIKLRNRLSRIDVAGQERSTPTWVFAPYLRLVRGDEQVLGDFEAGMTADDPRVREFTNWRKLIDRAEHRPSLAANRLGLTVHVGEDWADPLDGLHEVASAIAFYDLRPGDGIGHGLAMTTDVKAFSATRRKWALINKGAALDSLVWLFDLINQADGQRRFAVNLPGLVTQIQKEAGQIYGMSDGAIHPEDMVWLRKARVSLKTPVKAHDDCGETRWKLFLRDCSEEVRARRDRMVPADPRREDFDAAVIWAQEQVLGEVIRRRIVVEMNPASNLRISGADRVGLSPTVKMLRQIDNGLLASINTDNPGAFMSRVENEYALLLAGCRAQGVPEGQARALLEKARQIGMEQTWWPDKMPDPDDDPKPAAP